MTTGGADPLSTFFGQTSGGYSAGLNQQMQMFLQALQFQQQQAALSQAQAYGTQFGFAPGGNWMTWGAGGPTQPTAGTPTQAQLTNWAQLQQAALANALSTAGVTGQFARPQSTYAPGTVLTAPSQQPGMGPAYGVVNADGSLQMVSAESLQQLASQRGTTAQALTQNAQPVDWNTLQSLSQGAPTGPTQQTLAAQAQNYNQALQSGQLTGMFYDPSQTPDALLQQGKAMDGTSFNSLPPDQQQYWLQWNANNPTQAAQQWARAVNGALQQAGYTNPAAKGQQTLQAINQAATLSGMYNGAPTEAAREFNTQAAQNWAQMYGYTPTFDANGAPIAPSFAGLTNQTPGSVVRNENGQLGIVGADGSITPGDASNATIYAALQSPGSVNTVSNAEWSGAQAGGPQTLASQLQAANLSGMYQGAPTEAASEYARTLAENQRQANMQNALQQGQLGQQYLATAAQLQGPQNTFQLSNYLRGAQGNPNVPVYLQNLANNIGQTPFQATGSTAPTTQSAAGIAGQLGGQTSATPGWDYNQTLGAIQNIMSGGAQKLGPGALENLTPDELQALGSGIGAAGGSMPSFLQQYQQSRVGQQAPIARTSLV